LKNTLNGIKPQRQPECTALQYRASYSHEDHSLGRLRVESLTELDLQNWLEVSVCR